MLTEKRLGFCTFTRKFLIFMHLFEHKPDTVINIEGDLIINIGEEKPHKLRPRLAFNIFLNNTNLNFMAVVTSLNLTSAAPVQLFMTVVDPSGNLIAGVATAYAYAVGDP